MSTLEATGRVVKLIAPTDDELPDLPPILPGGRAPTPPPDAAALAEAVARIAADAADADDFSRVVRAGDAGLDALVALFPGTPRLDRLSVDPGSLRPSAHSAVIGAILRFGPRAIPRLRGLFDHLSPEVRYYAVCCFAALPAAPSLERIAGLLFDKDATVREMAAAVMERYRDDPAFARATAGVLRAMADESPLRRRLAAQAAGLLRLTGAIPALLTLLSSADGGLVEAGHRALVEITRQDLGAAAWRWRAWLDQHADAPRFEWVLAGLASEHRHVRQGSLREAVQLAGEELGYSVDAPPAERAAAIERWTTWWEVVGRRGLGR